MTNQVIEVIKKIRKREKEINSKKAFCRDHNFNLEAEKYQYTEDELRKVCKILQDEFDTGYIS